MNNNETFKMTYSAPQQAEVESIRQKYLPREADKMEQLRALDASVSRKANTVALTAGICGTLVMGFGMSLVMSEFGQLLGNLSMPVGIILGLAGMALLACAYPLYQRTLRQERKKIAPQILKLTDELMK